MFRADQKDDDAKAAADEGTSIYIPRPRVLYNIDQSKFDFIDMDVDTKATPARSQKKPQRVQKQRNRKPRNSIVFKAKSSGKDKRGSKRK